MHSNRLAVPLGIAVAHGRTQLRYLVGAEPAFKTVGVGVSHVQSSPVRMSAPAVKVPVLVYCVVEPSVLRTVIVAADRHVVAQRGRFEPLGAGDQRLVDVGGKHPALNAHRQRTSGVHEDHQ